MVAKYGADLPQNLMITIDGNIMAVAFTANAQHAGLIGQDVLGAGRRRCSIRGLV